MSLQLPLKKLANGCLVLLGLRLVSARWGPRGFKASLLKLRSQGFKPGEVVDVGASNGQWTRECMFVFPEAQYFLIDPLPENEAPLKALARRYKTVTYWRGVVGASANRLPFYEHGDQSSLFSSLSYPAVRPVEEVEVRTLDSFLGQCLRSPRLIKADVQGYEMAVLRGATSCLASAEVLLLEVSYRRIYTQAPLAHEVIAFVGSLGFRIYDICTYTLRPSDGELTQSDILFVKDGSTIFSNEGWA